MQILTIQENNNPSAFEVFLNSVSNKLETAIGKKLNAYSTHNQVNSSNQLKILKPKIWNYKGTIYKLRVDSGKESARIMFMKTSKNDIVLLHGFIKKTRKTPKKDASIAIENLVRVKNNVELIQLTCRGLVKT